MYAACYVPTSPLAESGTLRSSFVRRSCLAPLIAKFVLELVFALEKATNAAANPALSYAASPLLLLLLLKGSMCLRPDCGLCSICMHGFKMEGNVGCSPARNNRAQWLRYGWGIYFSSVSGKANDFSELTAKV